MKESMPAAFPKPLHTPILSWLPYIEGTFLSFILAFNLLLNNFHCQNILELCCCKPLTYSIDGKPLNQTTWPNPRNTELPCSVLTVWAFVVDALQYVGQQTHAHNAGPDMLGSPIVLPNQQVLEAGSDNSLDYSPLVLLQQHPFHNPSVRFTQLYGKCMSHSAFFRSL